MQGDFSLFLLEEGWDGVKKARPFQGGLTLTTSTNLLIPTITGGSTI